MAFGPIMRMKVGELDIELAPIEKEDTKPLVSPGMQQWSITRYFSHSVVPTLQDEYDWHDEVRKDKTRIVWGIWVHDEGDRRLIGTTAINEMTKEPLRQAVTGVMITDKAYWGRGIASVTHKARTWFAFEKLGIVRLKSAVVQGNEASLKALEQSGYNLVYVERNDVFIDGTMRHLDNLECLNPADWAWNQWWGGDEPTEQALAAREKTREALAWAEANVELP